MGSVSKRSRSIPVLRERVLAGDLDCAPSLIVKLDAQHSYEIASFKNDLATDNLIIRDQKSQITELKEKLSRSDRGYNTAVAFSYFLAFLMFGTGTGFGLFYLAPWLVSHKYITCLA